MNLYFASFFGVKMPVMAPFWVSQSFNSRCTELPKQAHQPLAAVHY